MYYIIQEKFLKIRNNLGVLFATTHNQNTTSTINNDISRTYKLNITTSNNLQKANIDNNTKCLLNNFKLLNDHKQYTQGDFTGENLNLNLQQHKLFSGKTPENATNLSFVFTNKANILCGFGLYAYKDGMFGLAIVKNINQAYNTRDAIYVTNFKELKPKKLAKLTSIVTSSAAIGTLMYIQYAEIASIAMLLSSFSLASIGIYFLIALIFTAPAYFIFNNATKIIKDNDNATKIIKDFANSDQIQELFKIINLNAIQNSLEIIDNFNAIVDTIGHKESAEFKTDPATANITIQSQAPSPRPNPSPEFN